ncbi:unnamed protein product [Acanthoscelides obtectus]|uniref:Uncharacterized protein n=1 Tax=Acanthoscelides obtectus TaxID=200917 RepID=A0A9P0JIX6_ACAOB|nr:unnamed protein product [Acanthoscelides obtectus]CAK1649937.1 hypothetical protein AOBTE_LOCUS16503 [Acanthoscelides obtectus]
MQLLEIASNFLSACSKRLNVRLLTLVTLSLLATFHTYCLYIFIFDVQEYDIVIISRLILESRPGHAARN